MEECTREKLGGGWKEAFEGDPFGYRAHDRPGLERPPRRLALLRGSPGRLYFYKMNHRPDQPDWPERDRFVLSKGHAAPTLYAVLARSGYFPREELWHLRSLGAMLQGHPDPLKHARGRDLHRFPGTGAVRGERHGPGPAPGRLHIPRLLRSSAMARARRAPSGSRHAGRPSLPGQSHRHTRS